MFATATLVLSLFVGSLVPSGPLAHGASPMVRAAHKATATATTSHRVRRRHVSGAAARAVERRLLLVASRSKLLARFVDKSTGLVQRNVTARCQLRRGLPRRRPSVYVCRVWRQPRLPSSGTRVL